MADMYELITYLERPGRHPVELKKSYLEVDYQVDDRNSFVFTRTKRIYREGKDAQT